MNELTVNITGITEENKHEKLSQFESKVYGRKCVNMPARDVKTVRKSIDIAYPDIVINLRYKDDSERNSKLEKALRTTAFSLGVPLKSGSGETFYFDSQKELTDIWCEAFSKRVKEIYDFVTDYFELPEMNVMSKANLKHKGKILYNPETGKPISTSEWNRFVTDLEKFLNRNKPAGEKIVLDAQALGRLLDKMLKTNSLESVRKMALKDIKVKEKSYEWVSDSVKHLNAVLGSELAGEQMARIEMLQRSAAQKVSGIDNAMKDNIKQILIDGVTNKKSKSQVSQDLFDKMVGHTRDFQRLADTEIQKNFNDAYIAGEINNTEPGDNVYFQRVEVIDGNTCEYCKKMNGKIAVWSKTPLSSGKVSDKDADLAIWEGKEWDGKKLTAIPDAPVSIFHPWCRGVWLRYDPAVGKI